MTAVGLRLPAWTVTQPSGSTSATAATHFCLHPNRKIRDRDWHPHKAVRQHDGHVALRENLPGKTCAGHGRAHASRLTRPTPSSPPQTPSPWYATSLQPKLHSRHSACACSGVQRLLASACLPKTTQTRRLRPQHGAHLAACDSSLHLQKS